MDDHKGKKKGRDSDDEDDPDGQYDIPEAGVMKVRTLQYLPIGTRVADHACQPDITFFGEQLLNTFFDRLTEQDRTKVDLVIVVGTSMKVAPVSEMYEQLIIHSSTTRC